MPEDKRLSKDLVGKTIVSKSGKKFGIVNDLVFETRTGELIYLILSQQTPHAETMDLEKNKTGDLLVPFSSVMSMGDFVIISEEDIV